MRLKSDKPIESKKQDTYDREAFANNIATQLCLERKSPSIVIGLTAPWGYGKTSCLNLIRETLYTTNPKPIIVEFNPWIVSTVDALLESFLAQFLSTVGDKLKKDPLVSFGENIFKYAKHLKPLSKIPQIGGFVSVFTETIENIENSKRTDILDILDVTNQKRKINDTIRELERPIIVFIDDLDRLPPDQLRSVIQLIKAVCDFERTSFLISYDPKPVAKALSYNDIYNGFQYLEKIVQSEYRLPKLTSEQLLNKISEESLTLIELTKGELSNEEKYILSRLLESTDFIYLFESPRDIHRLFNKIKTCFSHLANEVAFSDILFLCGIELKAPELFEIIQNEPYKFFASNLSHSEDHANASSFYSRFGEKTEKKKDVIAWITETLAYNAPKSDIICRLIEHHFTDLSNFSSSHDGYTGQKRISNKTTLLKAIHLGLVRNEYSYDQAMHFLESSRTRKRTFDKVFTSNQLTRKIEYIQSLLDESSMTRPNSIIDCVYECLDRIQIDYIRREMNPISRTLGDFLHEVALRITSADEQYQFFRLAITKAKHLAISEVLLIKSLKERNIWSSGIFYGSVTEPEKPSASSVKLRNKQLYDLTNLWLESVRKASKNSDLLNNQLDPLSVLYRWGQLNDNDFTEVQNYVIERSKTDRNWFIELSHSFHQHTEGPTMFKIIPFESNPNLEKIITENQSRDSHSEHLISFLKDYRANLEREKQKDTEND